MKEIVESTQLLGIADGVELSSEPSTIPNP